MYINVKPKKEQEPAMPCRWESKTRKFSLRDKLTPKKIIRLTSRAFAFCESDYITKEEMHVNESLMLMDCFSSWDWIKWQSLHCELVNWKFPASCRTMLSTQVINGSPTRKCRCLIIPRIKSNLHSIMANPSTAKRLVIHEMVNIKSAPVAVP